RQVVVAVKHSATVEPTSALPVMVPVQVYGVPPTPAAGAAHATAWTPASVLNTATGMIPAARPAGTTPVSVKLMLLVRVRVPVSAPNTLQVCPTAGAHGAPGVPFRKPAVA